MTSRSPSLGSSHEGLIGPILAQYPLLCPVESIEALGGAGGFSGAALWRVGARGDRWCLRRWPPDFTDASRLTFIHHVLYYVFHESRFQKIPVPVPTAGGSTYLEAAGHLWELTPWLPGDADYHPASSVAKLRAALAALAQFHQAAATARSARAYLRTDIPPGLLERRSRLAELSDSRLAAIAQARSPDVAPEVFECSQHLIERFQELRPRVSNVLQRLGDLQFPLQPCIRDIWHDHVLFQEDHVSGIVDFGAMRVDQVAGDVARLLASLAIHHVEHWQIGLEAYTAVRPLSPAEIRLLDAYHVANAAISGINWLDWIYLQGRSFPDWQRVARRVQTACQQLEYVSDKITHPHQ